MSQHDSDPARDETEQPATSTRRRFLSVAAVGGSAAVLERVVGGRASAQRIELGGEVTGWVGRRPAAIEGATNPTLPLTAGEQYRLTWENLDGAPHNFVIEDADGAELVRSDILGEEGATQTVEFTASEEMDEYFCEVHPNTMRGGVEIAEATPTATPEPTPTPRPTGTSEATGTETDEPEQTGETETAEETETPEETDTSDHERHDEPGFKEATVEEQRGDVARFTVYTGDADEARVVLGSDDVNFRVSFTAVDGNDDGEVTVAVDTFVAGRRADAGVSAVASADEIEDYEQETETLSTPLEVTTYPIELSVDGEVEALAALTLLPRETRSARSGVALGTVDPGNETEFVEAFAARDEVAVDDWAVVEVNATGIYATFDGREAIRDESLGYELTVEQANVVNAWPEEVPLEDLEFVVDEDEDRFFVAVDSSELELEETYEVVFAITDENPYVPSGEREEVSAQFTVVERSASFDADEPIRVPPDEATLSGSTTVAPGTTVTVSARGTGRRPFLEQTAVTVDADGTWSATLDFSDLEPGTAFTAEVVGLSPTVDGTVSAGE
ncbi:MAG: BGTF surface domain-containing protein [Halosimplex sp.]